LWTMLHAGASVPMQEYVHQLSNIGNLQCYRPALSG